MSVTITKFMVKVKVGRKIMLKVQNEFADE